MKDLQQPTVTTKPALVTFDFENYRSQLASYVEQYNIVVTGDTVKDAKKAATELNKLSNEIKSGFKAHIDELKAPANALSDHSKELQALCQDGRKAILEQVEKFEAETLMRAEALLTEFLDECRKEYGVIPDYFSATVGEHVKLGAVNANGSKLTKAARDAIESAVKDEYSMQQKVELRLAQLENESFKAGLDAPITRRHVESFLFSDQESWAANLKSVIDAEIERQEISRQKQREQFEREQQEKAAKIEAEKAQEAAPQHQEKPQAPINEPTHTPEPQKAVESDTGTKVVQVWVRFDIEVPSHVPESLVGAKVKTELQKLGKTPAEVRA